MGWRCHHSDLVFVICVFAFGNFLKPATLQTFLAADRLITVIGCGACFVALTAQINIAYDFTDRLCRMYVSVW